MLYITLLVTSSDDDASHRWLAAHHIDTWCLLVCERHATDGSLGVLLDLSLGLGSAVPVAEEETAILDTLLVVS